jgi:polyisoprenoid-binding protein YceI
MAIACIRLGVLLALAVLVGGTPAGRATPFRADASAIDVGQSRLTIFVYKSGFFSAFADDHVINAPIADGTVSTTEPLAVTVTVRARDLDVTDPTLSADKRREVRTRMLGPEVLDADTYPTITFASQRIEAAGTDRWTVAGRLTIHGQTREVRFDAAATNGVYRGKARIRQRDFGIAPISIAGGTVKVKDEIVVEFAIAAR